MGLFGKKKTPEEVLAEGRALYERGEYLDAALKLLKVNGNLNGEIDYWLGLSYLTYDQKRGKAPGRYEKFTVKYLTRSAQAGQPDAARLLAEQFGVRDYLPAEPTAPAAPEPEAKPEPKPEPNPQPEAAPSPDMDDLFALAEETGALIQEAQAQARQFTAREKSRPEPKPAPRPEPQPVPAPEPKPEPQPEPIPQPVPKAEAPAGKPISEMSDDEMYQKGMELFQTGKYAEAFPLLEKACPTRALGEKGRRFPEARTALGWMYETGMGTDKNLNKAYFQYSRAARTGNQNATLGLARVTAQQDSPSLEQCEKVIEYAKQLGTQEAASLIPMLEQKLTEAQQREAAEAQRKKAEALFRDGMAAYNAKDYPKALALLEQAAELGDAKAQFNCGMMYSNGKGTVVDKAKALYWYEKIAEQGFAPAQRICGLMYYNGEGTAVDKAKALYWYEKAAEQGDGDAQLRCSEMYSKGEGTAKDKVKADYWLKKAGKQILAKTEEIMQPIWLFNDGVTAYKAGNYKEAISKFEEAAEQGSANAQFYCGLMYSKGKGTAVDMVKALRWYEKAAEQGDATAQFNCGKMYYNGEGASRDKAKAKAYFQKAAAQTEDKEIQEAAKKILREYF